MNNRDIIDKKQLEANLARAKHMNVDGADFLLQRAMGDLEDRLAAHTRAFSSGIFVSPWAEYVAETEALRAPLNAISQLKFDGGCWKSELLDAEPNSQDIIIDMCSLHRINDVPGMLVQYNRALKPDGLLLACVPGGDTLHELRAHLTDAEAAISDGVHPRILPYMDVRDAGGLLQRAGFALPVSDVDSATVRYNSLFNLMLDLRAMGETNVLLQRNKKTTNRALFFKAAENYAQKSSDTDGRIRATFSLIWMSGWSPDSSQPEPKKPGSATHSLKDALSPSQKKL